MRSYSHLHKYKCQNREYERLHKTDEQLQTVKGIGAIKGAKKPITTSKTSPAKIFPNNLKENEIIFASSEISSRNPTKIQSDLGADLRKLSGVMENPSEAIPKNLRRDNGNYRQRERHIYIGITGTEIRHKNFMSPMLSKIRSYQRPAKFPSNLK